MVSTHLRRWGVSSVSFRHDGFWYTRHMRNIAIGILIGIVLAAGFVYARRYVTNYRAARGTISPIGQVFEKPLEKYSIARLGTRQYNGSEIVLDTPIATESAYTAWTFHYMSDGKKVTGLAHIPADATAVNKKPLIVQFRGWVDPAIYTPGTGTKRSAEVFAANGFISLAPDMLGYGGSDNPGDDVFEERFQTYIAGLNLLTSVGTLPVADAARVGIWGHSNGGQIALTILEITQKPYPATFWAPVTKPFPYSILYYTDEADDFGKALRKKLADFEREYDVDPYALVNFTDRLMGPMQLHQGTTDEAVPVKWNNDFVAALREKKKDIEYFVYPGADHNLQPSWNTVIARDIQFFRRQFGN